MWSKDLMNKEVQMLFLTLIKRIQTNILDQYKNTERNMINLNKKEK
jgi:hypothetical protein